MTNIEQAIKHPVIAFKLYIVDKVKPYPESDLAYLIEALHDA